MLIRLFIYSLIDSDNDSTTGYKNSAFWPNSGFDLYYQLNIADPNSNGFNGAYYHDPTAAQTAFTLIYIPVTSIFTPGAIVESSGYVESEYGLTRAQVNSHYVIGSKIRIAVEAWAKGWSAGKGDVPVKQQAI